MLSIAGAASPRERPLAAMRPLLKGKLMSQPYGVRRKLASPEGALASQTCGPVTKTVLARAEGKAKQTLH